MKPFGGIEQLAWSNDSKQIAYTSRKKQGLAYAVSTDSDIYLYNIEKGTTLNLCKLNGQDSNGTEDMTLIRNSVPMANTLHGKAWSAMVTKATETACASTI